MEEELKRAWGGLCDRLQSSCDAFNHSLQRRPIPLDSASSTFIKSLNRRLSTAASELNFYFRKLHCSVIIFSMFSKTALRSSEAGKLYRRFVYVSKMDVLLITALQLNGSDVGGWKVAVKVIPWEGSEFSTDQLAAMTVNHFERNRSRGISVTGYDTSLPADDVKSALSEHFSSCGLITDVFVLNRRALIYLYGTCAVHKALERSRREVKLSASGVGGWKLVAKAMPIPKPKIYIPEGPGNESLSSPKKMTAD